MRGTIYRGLAGFDTGVNLRESVDLDALGTDFRISGLQLEFLAVALTENYQGRLAKVYFGAVSADGQLIDRELIFVGYLNNMPLQIDLQRSDIVIDIQNVLARNRSGSNRRYTAADQRCFDPKDTLRARGRGRLWLLCVALHRSCWR